MNRPRKRQLNGTSDLTAVWSRLEREDRTKSANVVEVSTHLFFPLLSFLGCWLSRLRVFKSVFDQISNSPVRLFFLQPCGDRFLIRNRRDDKLAHLIFFALVENQTFGQFESSKRFLQISWDRLPR